MRFALADPPYPGQSKRLYEGHPDYAGEVDHAELIARLEAEFPDGWVLCTSAAALPEILALCPYERGTIAKSPGRVNVENTVRVLAWCKPQAPPYPVAVQYGWEPVILRGGRQSKWGRVRDWIVASPEGHTFRPLPPGHVRGAKPVAFCNWIFECLGARPGDELVDLFPGSGAVTRAWEAYISQPKLEEEQTWEQESLFAQAASSPELEPLISASSAPEDSGSSGNASPIPSAIEFLPGIGQTSLDIPTSGHYEPKTSRPWMSYVAEALARISPMPAGARGSTESARVFGPTTRDSFATFDPDTRFWRMCQGSLLEGLDEFSETWPRAGMTRSGRAFLLAPLAPLTSVIECGSSPIPTPTESDADSSGSRNPQTSSAHAGTSLTDFVRPDRWPTPTTQDSANDGGPSQYSRNSIPLNAAVKMWPTPSYADGKGGQGQSPKWTGGPSLRTAVKNWPTPKASDSNRDHGQASRYGPGQQRSNLKDALRHHGEEVGSLHPNFCEWLMGLPQNWTDPSGGPSPVPGPESASPTE